MLNVFCRPGQTCILCVIVSFSWDICETFTASKCNISCMQCVLTSHVTLQNTGPRCVGSCCNLPRPIKNISRLALYPCLTNLIKHCSVAQWPGPPRTHAQWISIVIGPDGRVSRNTWYTVVWGGWREIHPARITVVPRQDPHTATLCPLSVVRRARAMKQVTTR